jgi:hypothetical protein
MTETVYKKLVEIRRAHPKLLRSYESDLTKHDAATLRATKAGDRLIWMLRTNGTALGPIGSKMLKESVEYHTRHAPETVYVLITCDGVNTGTVRQIAKDEAERLTA